MHGSTHAVCMKIYMKMILSLNYFYHYQYCIYGHCRYVFNNYNINYKIPNYASYILKRCKFSYI